MKNKVLIAGVMAVALSAWTVNACFISGVVSCPNGTTAAGIVVSTTVDGVLQGTTTTGATGAYSVDYPTSPPGVYQICVVPSSLPAGFTSVSGCQDFTETTTSDHIITADFTLDGPACSTPPPVGPCWLTGGGNIGKTKGVPDYSYGGVVNPGCSPVAAGGGNWNVVDHLQNLHFKGQNITVDACGGVPTKSPKVNVNTIDFHGTGIIGGIGGNTAATVPVCFIAHAEDHHESGAGNDSLYLNVFDCETGATLMLISTDATHPLVSAPVTVSKGNLQIHTTGCDK